MRIHSLCLSLLLLVVGIPAHGVGQVTAGKFNTTPMPVRTVAAFPSLEWNGWTPVDDRGRQQDFRPIVLTHANDGSDRIFVATQRGVVHAFEKKDEPQTTKIFLDLSSQVRYAAAENEEGLLGLAFHPQYGENGEFFVYYTTTKEPHTSVIARRRVGKNPNEADLEFEEQLLKIKQPFWNHNGGGLAFGPDGYLYVSLGDGGNANDPHNNGQNTNTLFASILRIDVNQKSDGKPYGIPLDNPFAGQTEHRPEIFAYGLRNVWGMSFDSQTGDLWAADVGQNKWEEINLIQNGGNYGWNLREARYGFPDEATAKPDGVIDPIFEYDHDAGKSITGGFVYRGSTVPELFGHYVYADYVSGKIWALKYDKSTGETTANRLIESPPLPIISFGVDSDQELYFTAPTNDGRGLFRFQSE